MKARNIILTIAAVAVLTAPTTALAQPGPGPGDGSGTGGGWGSGRGPHGGGQGLFSGGEGGDHLGFFERMLPRMAEELGLSDEQLEKIQTVADTARQDIDEYAGQLRQLREDYQAEHSNPAVFDEDAFRAHVAAQYEPHTNLMVAVGKAKADAIAVLTPEQRELLEEMRGNFGRKAFRRGTGRRSGS